MFGCSMIPIKLILLQPPKPNQSKKKKQGGKADVEIPS